MSKPLKAVALKGTCPRCHEEVELILTKRQLKALLKGFKAPTPSQANLTVEKTLGQDKQGNLKT